MGTTTQDTTSRPAYAHPIRDGLDALIAEQRATRHELAQLRRLVDEAVGAYLAARYPYGRPTDRWGRRRA
jgi:hypothetical protein